MKRKLDRNRNYHGHSAGAKGWYEQDGIFFDKFGDEVVDGEPEPVVEEPAPVARAEEKPAQHFAPPEEVRALTGWKTVKKRFEAAGGDWESLPKVARAKKALALLKKGKV